MYVYIFVDSQHYLPTLLPTENQIIKYERVQFLDKCCCLREFVHWFHEINNHFWYVMQNK